MKSPSLAKETFPRTSGQDHMVKVINLLLTAVLLLCLGLAAVLLYLSRV
jgi:hypothetical protein